MVVIEVASISFKSLNLLILLFIKTCEGRGRTLCLQKERKYGHVIEVVTLMGGRMVMLQRWSL